MFMKSILNNQEHIYEQVKNTRVNISFKKCY